MGARPKFTKEDVRARMELIAQRIEKEVIHTLQYLGEQCVRQARENGDYNDITGNLRNSIGYVIVANGNVIESNFRRSAHVTTTNTKGVSRATRGSKDGLKIGQDYANEIAKEFTEGYALIVVAGMSYAVYVERKYHRDVLNSAEQYAEDKLPGLLTQLKRNVRKMKM